MGAKLYLRAPELFFRDCKICKEYLHDAKGVIEDVKDEPIKRPKEFPASCKTCDKYDNKTGVIWEKFTYKNYYYFYTFLVAYYFGVLPRAGGVDDQSPEIVRMLIILYEMFEKYKTDEEREFQMKIIPGMFGAK